MPKVRVHTFAMSLDGYVAGPDQSPDNPLGLGGTQLHEWAFATRSGRQMVGRTVATRVSTTTSSPKASWASAPPSWGATCSARSAGHGQRRVDRLGGRPALPPPGVRAHSPLTPARRDAAPGPRCISSTLRMRRARLLGHCRPRPLVPEDDVSAEAGADPRQPGGTNLLTVSTAPCGSLMTARRAGIRHARAGARLSRYGNRERIQRSSAGPLSKLEMSA